MQETTAKTEVRLRGYAPLLVGAALVLVTLASYRYVFRAGFVFDDAFYLVRNPHVQNGLRLESVKWAFTAFYGANWHPLTWLSSMLDYRVFGDRAAGHHAVNLLFHIANSVLLLVVLRRMTGSLWRSAFVAALFALHPLHVESVAWLSERKDVLSAFFMLAAMWAYVGYADRPGAGRYALVALAFALGLMSKPMLVSLPILLLMLDYWPLRRVSSLGPVRLLIEKLPLFALSIASGVITYLAQRSGEAVARLDKFPFGLRAANALASYVAYIWKTLCPAGLAAYYPYPKEGVPALSVIAAALLLAAVTLLAVRLARSRPYLIVGWLWYVVTLVPVIGLVQVGEQAMADRYMYIPMIGLGIMVAWGVPDLLARRGGAVPIQRPAARGLALVSAAVLIALAVVTSAQVRHWESDYTLFKRVVEVAPGSALAHSNYGLALAEKGQYDKAIEQYGKALDADPTYVRAYFNLGNALKETGRPDEALLQFREALRIDPNYTDAKVAAANVMVEQGDEDAAAAEYEKALEANPNDPVAHYNLGLVLVMRGRADEAVAHFERAVELDPRFDKAHYNLATIASRRGEMDKAGEHYSEALRINPKYAEAHHGLALVLRLRGRADEAADHLRRAVALRPDFAEAHNDLGALLAQQGGIDEAMKHFSAAVKYRPDFAEARCNLALGLDSRGDTAGAVAEYRRAIEADPNYVRAHGYLAVAYFKLGKYADAWREVRVAESLGMKAPPDFINALSSKMPPP